MEFVEDGGDHFRQKLKASILRTLSDKYNADDADYVSADRIADEQRKFYIIPTSDKYDPLSVLKATPGTFSKSDIGDATGIAFSFRVEDKHLWAYQHLWSIMVPNKKKTNLVTRICDFENQTVFAEQTEQLLTIARKVDILVINGYLITSNTTLLQNNFGFQEYIHQAAEQAINSVSNIGVVSNTEKLNEYINRGNSKYAKKMMRIGTSRVLSMGAEELLAKIDSVARWKDRFHIDATTNKIVLKTYTDVESFIDLFDERYTRSDITDTEYDTDVKTVAQPV
jgi:hypothetical protein